MEKETPVKIGLIAIGVLGVLGGVIWEAFRPVDAPTAMGSSGQSDWLAIIMQVGGVVSMLMAAFADVKKAIPADAIAAIKKMIKERTVDVGELIAIYGTIDMAAILELIKKLKGGFMPPIKIDGDVITIDPVVPIVDPNAPKPTVPVNPVTPIDPAVTDEDLLRHILIDVTKIKQRPVKCDVSVGGKIALSLQVATSLPTQG